MDTSVGGNAWMTDCGHRTNLDDAEIMRRVQGGQLELFDELVVRYRNALLRVAWSKLGDRDWAEDVVQEALLAAFAARRTYKPQFAVRTWLWTILLNLCRKQWKRRAQKRPRLSYTPLNWPEFTDVPEPADYQTGLTGALTAERRRIVAEMLSRLPEPQADAIRLRFFGDLKYAEIAQAMDSAVSTAKVRVRNGLWKLAKLLKEHEGGSS